MSESPDFDELCIMNSDICSDLIDLCHSLHTKVETLRRNVFCLDDLVFSLKSCCEHMRDMKNSKESWQPRFSRLNDTSDFEVISKFHSFENMFEELFDVVRRRATSIPKRDVMVEAQGAIDNAVRLFDDAYLRYLNESDDSEIVERFTELDSIKREIEKELDSLEGVVRPSSSIGRDVVDIENWVPEQQNNYDNNRTYNQPGKKRNTRNSGGSGGNGDLRQHLFFKNQLDYVQALDGEGDHHSDSDYSENDKAKKGAKKLIKDAPLGGAKKKGRPSNPKKGSTSAAAAAASKVFGGKQQHLSRQHPYSAAKDLQDFIAPDSDVEREEKEQEERYQHRRIKKREAQREMTEEEMEEIENDEVVGIDNDDITESFAQLREMSAAFNHEQEEEEENFFPHSAVFEEKQRVSAVRQADLTKKYGRHSGSSTSASCYQVISRSTQPQEVVDLSMELTQPASTSSHITSPSSTPPVMTVGAPRDSSPSRVTRSMDKLLAVHDEEQATHHHTAVASVSYPLRSRSNSNITLDSDTIVSTEGGGFGAPSSTHVTTGDSGSGTAAMSSSSSSSRKPVPAYPSQDAEFDEDHTEGPTTTTATTASAGASNAGVTSSSSRASSSRSTKMVIQPRVARPTTPPGVASSQSSHISPIPVNNVRNAFAGEMSAEAKRNLNERGGYWHGGEGEESEDPVVLRHESTGQSAVKASAAEASHSEIQYSYSDAVVSTPGIISTIVSGVTALFGSSESKKRVRDNFSSPVVLGPSAVASSLDTNSNSALSGRELRASKRANKSTEPPEDDFSKEIEAIEEAHRRKEAELQQNNSNNKGSSGNRGGHLHGGGTIEATKKVNSGVSRQDSIEDTDSSDDDQHILVKENSGSSGSNGKSSHGSGASGSNGLQLMSRLTPGVIHPYTGINEQVEQPKRKSYFQGLTMSKKTSDTVPPAPDGKSSGLASEKRHGKPSGQVIDLRD